LQIRSCPGDHGASPSAPRLTKSKVHRHEGHHDRYVLILQAMASAGTWSLCEFPFPVQRSPGTGRDAAAQAQGLSQGNGCRRNRRAGQRQHLSAQPPGADRRFPARGVPVPRSGGPAPQRMDLGQRRACRPLHQLHGQLRLRRVRQGRHRAPRGADRQVSDGEDPFHLDVRRRPNPLPAQAGWRARIS